MLKHLKLENFRNHKIFELDFEQTTVLVGRNGVGKSNILESLVVLSFCRSFREEKKVNLINHDCDFAKVTGDDLEAILCRSPQFVLKVRVGSVPKRTTDFVGTLPSVVFSPETISIITGSPSDRRRFLDVMISQVNAEYLRTLIDYTKIRRQRNQLLKSIKKHQASERELDYWDSQLVELGEIISQRRKEAIGVLNENLALFYRQVSRQLKADLVLTYQQKSLDLAGDILAWRGRDIAEERTNLGPHSDDLLFRMNGWEMVNYASRGEIKSAILSLKISELKYLEKRLKSHAKIEKPLLLLDDIFSEFDSERRQNLFELIGEHQSLITTTEKDFIGKNILPKVKIVELM